MNNHNPKIDRIYHELKTPKVFHYEEAASNSLQLAADKERDINKRYCK